ncbi:MAG: baseplate J/gp47 family protein [Halanaerobiales bacterium]
MKVRGYRVFYIDNESGIKDLIEILKHTTAVKIALVIKNGQLILNSSVNLQLLKKYVKKYRKELVFINPDLSVYDKVITAGFLLYSDLNTLEKDLPIKQNDSRVKRGLEIDSSIKDIIAVGSEDENTKRDSKRNNRRNNSRKKADDSSSGNKGSTRGKRMIRLIVTAGIFLFIIAMAYLYFLYPTATIEIEPVIKTAKHEIAITASTDSKQIDWENSTLPLHETEVEISGQEVVQCSGLKLVGHIRAEGVVKFINERQEEVVIPAGTVLMTDNNIKFTTIEDVLVPELQVDYLMDVPVGMKAGQIEVGIKAVNPGSSGNVGIGRIKKIASPVENVYVVNPEPSRGGSDKRIPLVSEEDQQRAREILDEKLRSKLITRIYQELGGNYRIVENEINYSDPVYEFSHKIGEESDTLTVSGSLTARGYLLKNNEIDRLVTRIFKDRLPADVQLMSSGINIESLQLEEIDESMYNILIGVNAPVISDIDSENLANQLSGMAIAEAQALLDNMADVDNYLINSQKTNLPNMSFAIKVVVREPEEMKVFNISE